MLSLAATKTYRELAWDYALTARMNAIYYRRKVSRLKKVDTFIKFGSILIALSGFGTFFSAWSVAGPWLSLIAAILMAIDLALQFPERVRELGVLLAEYEAHRAVFENLYQFDSSDEQIKVAIHAFQETEKKEAKLDPSCDPKLLRECQAQVLEEIGEPARA